MYWKKVVTLCLCVLTPYLFLGFFNFPSADDFTYAVPMLQKGFWQAQVDWYTQWSGRFVSTAVLSVSPITFKSYVGYKLIGITTFSFLFGVCIWFLNSLTINLLDRKTSLGFSILVTTVFLSEMPSISEAFHWYAGVVNYTYAFIVFLLGIGLYLRVRKISIVNGLAQVHLEEKKWILAFMLSVISFLLAGFNETLVLVWLYFIFAIEIFFAKKMKRIDAALLFPFFVGLLSFYFVYKAPGNAVRSSQFQGNHDVLFTLFRPLGLFFEIFIRYLKIPLLLFLWLLIPEIEKVKGKVPTGFYTKQTRWLTLFFFLSLVFLFLAPAHWAIGGAPPRRAMNILCFIYVLFTLCMYCQWIWAKNGQFLSFYQRLPNWLGRNTQVVLLLLSFFVVSNHGVAWADLLFRARDYALQQQERIDVLESANPNSEIVFEPLRQRPETLFFSELEKDPTDWINQSVAGFYRVRWVRIR